MKTVPGGTERAERAEGTSSRFEHGIHRGEMPFLDHLEEMRWRIFKAGGALVAAAIVGFLGVHYLDVTSLLIRPIEGFLPGGRLHAFSPITPFFLELKLALLAGIIIAFPIILYQVWAFLSPALQKHEKRIIVPALYMGLVLFSLGVALAYFIALPVSLEFLFGFQPELLTLTIGADEYLAFVVRLLMAFGVIFELPVVIMILSALGLVTPAFLKEKRRHAVVAITIVAAFLSPGDVIMVTLLMMVPLILLYEFSIVLSRMVVRQKAEHSILSSSEPPDGAVEAE